MIRNFKNFVVKEEISKSDIISNIELKLDKIDKLIKLLSFIEKEIQKDNITEDKFKTLIKLIDYKIHNKEILKLSQFIK